MRIDGQGQISQIEIPTNRQETPEATPSPSDRTLGDRLEFSTKGLRLAELSSEASETPEVRLEKVEEIKKLIETSSYTIRAEEVAGRIISGSLISKKA